MTVADRKEVESKFRVDDNIASKLERHEMEPTKK